MNSVRGAALTWMTLLLTLVGLVGAGAAYLLDYNQANILLDRQLEQIALNTGTGFNDLPPRRTSTDGNRSDDEMVVDIWDSRNDKVYSNTPGIDIPRLTSPGFATVLAQGQSWRAYMSPQGQRSVQASQRVSVRARLARTAVFEATVPILAMIPLGWLVIGWGLRRVFGRLSIVAAELAARGVETRHLIPVVDIPVEVLPLVEAMNLLIGRLQTSIEQQKRFVSDAAHELRTPLAALRLQIDNLLPSEAESAFEGALEHIDGEHDVVRKPRPSFRHQALTDLGRGADRAAALVDQLLRLARYDAGAYHAEKRAVVLVPLILSCVADHLQIAEGKHVDLGIVASDRVAIEGNERDLKILFDNLIQNAVRYTPAGGIVDVAVRRRGEAATIEVSDTGCGIREDLLPRVFDRFFRAAPADIEGTGLGLSICKAIAARHGLTITLANRPNGGLTAVVTGPLALLPAAQA